MGFEVALTRVFAVLLRYHFAFLIISIALCGLGLGGYLAHWWRRRRAIPLPLVAALFGISIDIALLVVLRVLFAHAPQAYWLAAVIVLIPFTLAGVFLAECFAGYSAWSGRLYAWDLAGAALAAMGIVALLQLISAINACLLMGVLAAATAFMLHDMPAAESGAAGDGPPSPETVPPPRSASGRAASWLLILATIVIFIANPKIRVWDIPPIPPQMDANETSLADRGITQPLFAELAGSGKVHGEPIPKIVETRWNAFARTDVVTYGHMPNMYYVYTNGNVPTNMLRWDGQVQSIDKEAGAFPLNDWAFASAHLGSKTTRAGAVLAIGPGGGLDALLALRHGAAQFDGAEINPSIVGLMHDYRAFNGGIYERPDVHVETAEGRAFVRDAVAHGKRYNLLYSALTKTATAGQGMALLESYIYTVDAVEDYLSALTDEGQFVIVVDNNILAARFVATGVAALNARGIKTQEAMRHIAVVFNPDRGSPYVYAIAIRKKPITRADADRIMGLAYQRQLEPVWIPDQADAGLYGSMASGQQTLAQFTAQARQFTPPLNIEPCPDDRPFVLDLNIGALPFMLQLTVLTLVLALGLALAGWLDARRQPAITAIPRSPRDAIFMLYFLALGVGFMLVEIPLSQKLILPLGYPTLALTVILFSVLLGGGVGAWASQRFSGPALRIWAVGCAVAVAVGTVALVPVLGALHDAMLLMSLPQRCVVTAIVLLPLGFLLGTPFPAGMRLFAARRPDFVPLVWGMNGVASVVGSLCAAMGARELGFVPMLGIGAAVYLVAGILLLYVTAPGVDDVRSAPTPLPAE